MIREHSTDVMNAVRDEAFENFKTLGIPTKKLERYKYTDMTKLFEPNYGVNLKRLDIPVNPYDAFRCDVPNLSTSLYFIVNDTFYTKTTPKAQLPDGVRIGSLKAEAEKNPELIAKYYARLANTSDDGITALNTMLAQDGLLVYVPKNVRVERAVQVINILRSDVDLMINRRVLIIVEEGAEIKLLFCDHAADDRNFLTTQVIEAYVGRNASLDLYCMEETHEKNVRVSNLYIDQEADSRVNHNIITLHNGVTRNRTDLTLSGEGAECVLNGCAIADRTRWWTTTRSSTIRFHTATARNSTNMCLTERRQVPSPDASWCAKERRRQPRRSETKTSVPHGRQGCSHNRCLKSMPTT